MLALEILDIKDFTSKLFVGNVFDTFCLSEAAFTTFLTCTIDGKLKNQYNMICALRAQRPCVRKTHAE